MYNPSQIFKPSKLVKFDELSTHDLMNQTTEVYVVDMHNTLTQLTADAKLMAMLKPPPPGVYTNNSAVPLLRFDKEFYFSEQAVKGGLSTADIRRFEDFINTPGDVYDMRGFRVAISSKAGNRFVSEYPTYNTSAYYTTILAIYAFFRQMAVIVEPSINLEQELLSIEDYVLPEYILPRFVQVNYPDGSTVLEDTDRLFDPEQSVVISHLLGQIWDFVGRDQDHIYRINVVGMSIYIEKGVDARVYEYHRMIQSHFDSMHDEQYTQSYRDPNRVRVTQPNWNFARPRTNWMQMNDARPWGDPVSNRSGTFIKNPENFDEQATTSQFIGPSQIPVSGHLGSYASFSVGAPLPTQVASGPLSGKT